MGIERQPFPLRDPIFQQAFQRLYNAQAGKLDKFNVRSKSLDVASGTKLSHGDAAGRLDAVYATISFGSSASAVQTASATHALGRVPIGFEVVNRDGPMQIYSNTASAWTNTGVYFGAIVWGAATANNATVRIW